MNIDNKIRAVREAQTRLESACANCDPDAELARLERGALVEAFFLDFIAEIERLRKDLRKHTVCWHCGDFLDLVRPRCEWCLDDCDVEECESLGCLTAREETL